MSFFARQSLASAADNRRGCSISDGATPQGFYVNDGTRDVGSTPTQILLLRGLDALTNEEEIVTALSRVGGRASGAVSRGGVKKVFITKDRASRQSWGFAFVQFSDVKVRFLLFISLLTTQADKIKSSISSQLKFSVLLSTPLSIPPVSSFAIESSPSPSLTRILSFQSTRNLTGHSEEKETNNSLTGTTKDTFNLGSLLLQLRRKSPRFRKDLKRTKMRRWIKI